MTEPIVWHGPTKQDYEVYNRWEAHPVEHCKLVVQRAPYSSPLHAKYLWVVALGSSDVASGEEGLLVTAQMAAMIALVHHADRIAVAARLMTSTIVEDS